MDRDENKPIDRIFQGDSMELNGIFNMILNGTMLIERFIMEVVGCLFSDRLKLYMYIESQSRHVA
jgi:hypothetical protein